jgi:ADP-ribose pyrophosphatase
LADYTHALGMSSANMKLVVLDVPLEGDMESPDQKLEDGEAIVRRAIELRSLNTELKGKWWCGAVPI